MPRLILSQPSTDMAMMAAFAAAGWKDVMLDLEHAPHAEADVVRASVALSHAGATTHLKMADRDPETCARYLHFGIRDFLLPHVEQASQVRAIRERMDSLFWIEPSAIHLCPMIESRAGAEQIPAIAAERGVTAIQVGTVDLALDLGFGFSSFKDFAAQGRDLMPHLLEVLDAARAAGKPNGCMLLRSWLDFFPLDRVDQVTVPVGDLLSPASAGFA